MLALAATFSWGCAFPLIKLGLAEFQIDPQSTGSKALFAGIRFFLAGFVVLILARMLKRSFEIKEKAYYGWIVLFALVNTALHYFFFYIGLSNTYGSRASILDSLSTFLLVFLACLFFKEEHLHTRKVVGCICGFGGILILNAGGGSSGSFTMMGDGMMILNSFCMAFGGILTRIICRKMDALFATGLGLSIGGFMLIVCGKLMGGVIPVWTGKGCVILFLLVCVSSVGFSIYNQLMQFHPVGNVAIYNSLIPVFGVILSCLLLGEAFMPQYIPAGLLVSAGVYIVNRQ